MALQVVLAPFTKLLRARTSKQDVINVADDIDVLAFVGAREEARLGRTGNHVEEPSQET